MLQTRSPSPWRSEFTVMPIFFPSVPLMNPRTLCACQPVAFMICASVAPPLRWSRPRTSAFLLPSRAAGVEPPLARFPLLTVAVLVFEARFAPFGDLSAFLAAFGAALVASVLLSPFRLWIAYQIRLTADFRSVNFFTGVRPGMLFQTSISRPVGQFAANPASSCWLLNLSPSPASCSVPHAVMLFSLSMLNVILLLLCRRCGVDIHHSGWQNWQVNSA